MLGDSTIWNALAAMPRKVSCKIELGGNTITEVKELKYSSDWSGRITIGQVISSYISVTIPTPAFSISGQNVTLSMGVTINNAVSWVNIGVFRVAEESIRTRQGYTSFNAYDKLYDSNNTYQTALTFPVYLSSIYAEVCSQLGLTSYPALTYNPQLTNNPFEGYTLRDVLGFIAGAQGKNAYLSPAGALELRWFTAVSSSSYTADGTKANVPYIGETVCNVQRLICSTDSGVMTAGSNQGIYFNCPFMTQDRLNAMVSGLSFSYNKAEVDIPYGNFCLQAGDIITVSTTGSNLSIPIMANSWSYDGGLSSSVSSYGVSDYQGTANNAERSVSAQRVKQIAANREFAAATAAITGATGGYIKINFGNDGKTAELLIMDRPDINQAQNIWVFNQNGLGHFSNGYGRDYVNVALTSDGTIAADRVAGQMISGVGIENLEAGTGTRAKITVEQGSVEFKRVAAEPNPTVSLIGAIRFEPRAAADDIDSISIRAQKGKAVTIGYENNGTKNDDFVYYSDLSDPLVPSDAAKFNFWGDLRIFNNLHWISLTDLEQRIEALEQNQ